LKTKNELIFIFQDCKLTTEELKLAKFRSFQDPLRDIRKYLKTPGVARKLEEVKGVKRKAVEPNDHSSSSAKKSKKEKKKKSKKSKKSKKHKSESNKESKRKNRKSSSKQETNVTSSTSEEDSEDEMKRKNLERLRTERLEREREEKRKTDKLLAKLRGDKDPEEEKPEKSSEPARGVKQRYNSQFNPELARQNYDFR